MVHSDEPAWWKRFKSKPAIATTVLIAALVASIASWSENMISGYQKIRDFVGDNPQTRARELVTLQRAYDAGVLIDQLYAGTFEAHPSELFVNDAEAQLGADLDKLNIKIEVKSLSYGKNTTYGSEDSQVLSVIGTDLEQERGVKARIALTMGYGSPLLRRLQNGLYFEADEFEKDQIANASDEGRRNFDEETENFKRRVAEFDEGASQAGLPAIKWPAREPDVLKNRAAVLDAYNTYNDTIAKIMNRH